MGIVYPDSSLWPILTHSASGGAGWSEIAAGGAAINGGRAACKAKIDVKTQACSSLILEV